MRRSMACVAMLATACGAGPQPLRPPRAPRESGAESRAAPGEPGEPVQLTPRTNDGSTPDPQDAPPSVRMSPARPPAEHGWYTASVRVTADAFDDRALEDVCFWVVPNYPQGTSTSSVRLPCSAPTGRRWTGASELKEEARHIVQLQARDSAGQEARAQDLDVRIDLTAPTSTLAPRAGPFRGPVSLKGEASDASSGVRRVTLVFSRQNETQTFPASCACPDLYRRNRPPEPWSFEGRVPPGRWTLRVRSADYAGLEEREGATAEIEVL